MKYSIVALASLVALAGAQDIKEIPDCALKCIDQAIKDDTDCKTSDYPCLCANLDKIQTDTTAVTCIVTNCPDITAVIDASQKFCDEVAASVSASGFTAVVTSSSASVATTESTSTNTETAASPTVTGTEVTGTDFVTTATSPPTTATHATTAPSSSVPAAAAGVGSIGGVGMFLLGLLAL